MPDRQSQPQAAVRRVSGPAFGWVAYTMFILLTGTNLPTPLYHGYEQIFGHSALTTTLIFAAYVAALVPSLLIAGPLADSVGRRVVLLPALLMAVAGTLTFLLAGDTFWLFLARIMQGVAIGAASGALTASLSELEPTGNRRRAALVTTAVSLGGLGAGPLTAGVLAQYAPAPYAAPFILEIVLLSPAFVFMMLMPDKTTRTPWQPSRPSIPARLRRVFIMSGTANFLAFSVIGLFLSLVPAYVVKLSGLNNQAVAGATVTLMLACSIAAQIAGYGKSSFKLQFAGLAVFVPGLIMLILAGALMSLPLLITSAIAAGIGHGFVFLGGMTEINSLAPENRRAETISAFYVIIYLGVGGPVIGAGLLATMLGSLLAVQIFAGLIIPIALFAMAALVFNQRASEEPLPVECHVQQRGCDGHNETQASLSRFARSC